MRPEVLELICQCRVDEVDRRRSGTPGSEGPGDIRGCSRSGAAACAANTGIRATRNPTNKIREMPKTSIVAWSPSPPSPDQGLNRRFQGDGHERGKEQHVDQAPDLIEDQEGGGGERHNHDDNQDRVRKPGRRSLQPSAEKVFRASHCRSDTRKPDRQACDDDTCRCFSRRPEAGRPGSRSFSPNQGGLAAARFSSR